ncbi:MAG: protein kinase [Pirellulales bacterium]|nr:protein kinase [Pirellulales bacterium]
MSPQQAQLNGLALKSRHAVNGAAPLKPRQLLGKYKIERRLAEGGFAHVYRAMDTVEGIRVALKIPHSRYVDKESLDYFRREARLAAKLDHPHILQLKDASFIDGRFVIAFPLGSQTLDDRLGKRMAISVAITLVEQILEAVAFAHERKIIHCDLKPENMILFPDNSLRLTDFGIAKVAQRTVRASGSGTLGYMAPEQAMGKPSFRSDVFSLGLILYRMLSGELPEWPFHQPLPGAEKLQRRVHPEFVKLLNKALEVDPNRRFRDAGQMLAAFNRIKAKVLRYCGKKPRSSASKPTNRKSDWQTIRRRQFQREFAKVLETRHECSACGGPVSEAMIACPWCGKGREKHEGDTRFSHQCPRCHRGMKADWSYCAWCFGPGFEPASSRSLSDTRYVARCTHSGCAGKELMPWMRYCPWCRRKVRQKWQIAGSSGRCRRCGWGIVRDYWNHCPWCAKSV